MYLFAVDCLKHMSGLGLQFIGSLTLGHIKKEEVQKMNDFPWFKTSYQGFCGYVDLQVDKEHLRRVVMGNKDQQTKWNTLQGSKLLTPVMRHMSCLCIQPLSETRRGPQEIHVLRSFSSLCNSGSTLQCYFVHNRIKHVSLSQHTNQAISTPEKACHSPYMTT